MKKTLLRVTEIALVLVVILVFAPTTVGGAASYVRIHGSSMYPTFQSGDTVLLTRDDHYAVGDIIAYHSQQLGGTVVIHRIIEVTPEGRYVTQGDNNDFIDGYQPERADVIGKQTLRLPGASKVAQLLSGPTGIIVLAVGVSLLLFFRPRPKAALHRHRAMRGRML